MTEERMALIELVEKQADGDLVREMLDRGVEVEIRPLADDPKVDCASVL